MIGHGYINNQQFPKNKLKIARLGPCCPDFKETNFHCFIWGKNDGPHAMVVRIITSALS